MVLSDFLARDRHKRVVLHSSHVSLLFSLLCLHLCSTATSTHTSVCLHRKTRATHSASPVLPIVAITDRIQSPLSSFSHSTSVLALRIQHPGFCFPSSIVRRFRPQSPAYIRPNCRSYSPPAPFDPHTRYHDHHCPHSEPPEAKGGFMNPRHAKDRQTKVLTAQA